MNINGSFDAVVRSLTSLSESTIGEYAPKGDRWNPKKSDMDEFVKDATSQLHKHGWKETHGTALYSHPKYGNTIADLNSGSLMYHVSHGSDGHKVYDVHPKDIEKHLHHYIANYSQIMDHEEAEKTVGSHIANKYKGLYGGNINNRDDSWYDNKDNVNRSKENEKSAGRIAVKHGVDPKKLSFKIDEEVDIVSSVARYLSSLK